MKAIAARQLTLLPPCYQNAIDLHSKVNSLLTRTLSAIEDPDQLKEIKKELLDIFARTITVENSFPESLPPTDSNIFIHNHCLQMLDSTRVHISRLLPSIEKLSPDRVEPRPSLCGRIIKLALCSLAIAWVHTEWEKR